MIKFALKNIVQVNGKQKFDMLLIDGVAPFETFIDELEAQYKSESDSLFAIMQDVADLKSLPNTKFHPLKGSIDYREYEIKTKHLRVYLIEQYNGKIVVMGGTKANQVKDISRFRKIKKQYVQSLNLNAI